MVGYNVTVSIDGATRDYLMGHSYSMYVFKGVQAGSGADQYGMANHNWPATIWSSN